ncbi:hypothetical protein ACWNT8_12650 [Pigmentibacter ruber]
MKYIIKFFFLCSLCIFFNANSLELNQRFNIQDDIYYEFKNFCKSHIENSRNDFINATKDNLPTELYAFLLSYCIEKKINRYFYAKDIKITDKNEVHRILSTLVDNRIMQLKNIRNKTSQEKIMCFQNLLFDTSFGKKYNENAFEFTLVNLYAGLKFDCEVKFYY